MDGYEARLAEGRMTSTNSCFKKTNHNLPRKTPVPTLSLIKARVSPGLFGVLLQYLQQSRKEPEERIPPAAHHTAGWPRTKVNEKDPCIWEGRVSIIEQQTSNSKNKIALLITYLCAFLPVA